MSMSEFEKQEHTENDDSFPVAIRRLAAPDDFTAEDLAFAEELNALFSPEEENLPPYYVQTLLDADDQRFEAVSREFEHRTSAQVFRRLKLRRRIFSPPVSPLRALSTGIGDRAMRRSLIAMVGMFILVLLLTVAFTGSSFAAGVAILLGGTHRSGVYLTDKYPVGLVQSAPYSTQNDSSAKIISLLSAQDQLLFPLYLPAYMLPEYELTHISLYVGMDQQWANGPMLEFEFSELPSHIGPRGMGKIWVREFEPRADVLQLVKAGASTAINPDSNGRAQAIYVDGAWDVSNKVGPQWVAGERSELIYQVNGVIFWIVGDQLDGVGESQLLDIAHGLAVVQLYQQIRVLENKITVAQLSTDALGPFSTDVIVVYPGDSSDGGGPYYIGVSASQPPKNAH